MKRLGLYVLFLLLLAISVLPLSAQDKKSGKSAKKKEYSRKIEFECAELEIPEIEIDLHGLELSLQNLQITLAELQDIEIPAIEVTTPPIAIDVAPIDVAIPPIAFEMPAIELAIPPIAVEIPPIPPIEFPEIDFNEFNIDCNASAGAIFQNLSEEEQLQLKALRALASQGADQAIAAYQQLIKKNSRPALRYEAVRQLGNFLNDERIVPLLGDAAKNDRNVEVRKKAIALLGKSDDPRARKILEEIVRS